MTDHPVPLPGMEIRTCLCVLRSPVDVREKRDREFRAGVKKMFVRHLAESLPEELSGAGLLQEHIQDMHAHGFMPPDWEVHHKQPLWLGGANMHENLVMLSRRVHQKVHKHLDAEVKGMQVGQRRHIRLLWPTGSFYARGDVR